MYIAIQDFISSSGNSYFEGDKISNLRYFFMPRRDKIMFSKKHISKGKTVTQVSNPVKMRFTAYPSDHPLYGKPKNYEHSHYGYGPEPGYTSEVVPTSHYIQTDDVMDMPTHNSIPHFSGWGGGDAGGAGASGSWGEGHSSHSDHSSSYDSGHSSSYDSGSSYSDSSSSSDSSSCSDSGGGDSGGGCDGGGGGD